MSKKATFVEKAMKYLDDIFEKTMKCSDDVAAKLSTLELSILCIILLIIAYKLKSLLISQGMSTLFLKWLLYLK